LGHLSQKERRLVIKPSGFSPLAWGSRGVTVGHDISEQNWQRVIEEALLAFSSTPSVLQEFHKGRQVEVAYYDLADRVIREMSGRVRLTPYYFVVDEKAELAGIPGIGPRKLERFGEAFLRVLRNRCCCPSV